MRLFYCLASPQNTLAEIPNLVPARSLELVCVLVTWSKRKQALRGNILVKALSEYPFVLASIQLLLFLTAGENKVVF